LSLWGPALVTVNGFYAPELLAPPLVIYLWARRPRVLRSILRCIFSPLGVAAALWLSLVAIIGIALRGSVVGPYSEWRASLVLVYLFLLMYTRRGQQGRACATHVMWLSFATLCLDALFVMFGILSPGLLGQMIPAAEEAAVFGLGRFSVPALNILVVSYLATRGHRLALLAAALVLGGALSLGGHRVVLAATLISALFVPLVMFGVLRARRIRRRWLRLALALMVVVAMIATFRSDMIQNYLDEATGIQNRLFTHTIDTIDGIKRGLTGYGAVDYGDETIRAAYAAYLLTEWPSLALPHGLGSREVEGRLGNEFNVVAARWRVSSEGGNTHDNAVLYAAYHHGLLMTGLVALLVAWLILHRLRMERGLLGKIQIAIALGGVFMVDMIYPPVPGTNVAAIYGLFLGTLLNPAARRPLLSGPAARHQVVSRRVRPL
ncbi:MAG: hypothetical protein ACR2L2_16470, partial [Acidobacteriota bacterium]